MEQRELDRIQAEIDRDAEQERMRKEVSINDISFQAIQIKGHDFKLKEIEKPPYDELQGNRVHSWVLLLPGSRELNEPIFVEPSTGLSYQTDSPIYCGVESVWDNRNYWVNT